MAGGVTERQREREDAPPSHLTVESEGTPVQLDDALRQRQPEPGARLLALAGRRLLERLEDAPLVLRRDADARVADGDLDGIGGPAGADRDRPATRGELHGVGEQVEEYLPHLPLVGLDDIDVRVAIDHESDAGPLRALAQHRDAGVDDGPQRER